MVPDQGFVFGRWALDADEAVEEARLEEVRKQLEEQINRVRQRRAEHEKRLELDVDP